jgi:hypothetical protein
MDKLPCGFYLISYILVIFVTNAYDLYSESLYKMLQCLYLDLVRHVQDFLKYNKLVLILFEKQTRYVAKVLLQVLYFHIC